MRRIIIMRKLCLLCLTTLLLLACVDNESTNSAPDIFVKENSFSIKLLFEDIQDSSSSEHNKDSSYRSSKEKAEDDTPPDTITFTIPKDTTSSSSETGSSNCQETENSQTPYVTVISPIRIRKTTVYPNTDQSEFVFKGGASVDESCYIKESENELLFTDLGLTLAYVNENGTLQGTPIQITDTAEPTFPTPTIDFEMMGVKMSDPEKTQCGTFRLFITFIASYDSTNPTMFVSRDSVEFIRKPEFCQTDPTSSSATEDIYSTIELSMNTGSTITLATTGFSFKDNSDVPKEQAQIQIRMDELTGILTLYGVNGYKVAQYKNQNDRHYDDDWTSSILPPSPVHISDFRFASADLSETANNFNDQAFWIVIGPNFNENTGEDFCAVTLKTKGVPDANGATTLEIIYYKK